MGFTHYLYQSRAFTVPEWDKITAEARRIIAAATAKGISLCGPMGNNSPILDAGRIALNGNEDNGEDHESFILDRMPRMERGEKEAFSFCKTARKPYDPVVVSILVAARDAAPDAIRLSSDGGQEALHAHF